MSAILSVYHRDGQPAEPLDLTAPMDAMAHRGRDGQGIWHEGPVSMGHRMCWTTPESLTEVLPLVSHTGNYAITADARIDNRDALCDQLKVEPGERSKLPDSALILMGYERWGEAVVDWLLGDFAFAIWDRAKQELFCATDPLGVKPIYYFEGPHLFALASQITALLSAPGIPKRLNEEGLATRLTFYLSIADKAVTCFDGIRALPPGHTLTVGDDAVRLRAYWEPDPHRRLETKTDEAYLESFRALFDDAVRARLRSAFPVATMLSGGLDSSSIACVAARRMRDRGQQLIALASVLPAGHKGPEEDERYYIDLIRDQKELDVEYVTGEGWPIFGPELEALFDRTGSPNLVPTHYRYTAMYNTASRRGVRVILDGIGGEMGATSDGPGYLASLALHGRWLRLGKELRALSTVLHRPWWHGVRTRVLNPLMPIFWHRANHVSFWRSQSILDPQFADRIQLDRRLKQVWRSSFHTRPNVRRNELSEILVFRGPKYGFGIDDDIEIRCPFMDRRLVEFCLAVPGHLKVQNGWTRFLIRQGMAGVLPGEVRWRITKGPIAPDMFLRLKSTKNQIQAELDTIGLADPVRRYVDVARMKSTLEHLSHCSGWEPLHGNVPARDIMQTGMHAIRFLRWFDSL